MKRNTGAHRARAQPLGARRPHLHHRVRQQRPPRPILRLQSRQGQLLRLLHTISATATRMTMTRRRPHLLDLLLQLLLALPPLLRLQPTRQGQISLRPSYHPQQSPLPPT